MLTIRDDQLEVFRSLPRRQLEESLARDFETDYPEECQRAGRDAVREAVALGLDKAEEYGLETEEEAAYLINLMFMLGSEFDSDPQVPWAGETLANRLAPPRERVRPIFDRAIAYLDEICGEDESALANAVVRARELDVKALAGFPSERAEDALLEILRGVYPEKWAAQGEAANRRLVQQGIRDAHGLRLRDAPGQIVLLVTRFLLGHGVARDPLHPWAGRILEEAADGSPGEPGASFHQEMVAFLDAALAEREAA